jgi:DNA-binding IclR family transcriptional regulator
MAKLKTKLAPARRRPSKTTYAAPALEKGIDILELLASAPEGLTSTEIAQRLGRSLSEIFRILVVMERRNWLHKSPQTDRYRVSYRVLENALRATPVQALSAIAAGVMYELSYAVVQSCHMAVVSDTSILIVLQQDSPAHSGFSVRLGTHCDALASCSGHVLLAFSDPPTVEKVLGTLAAVSAAKLDAFRSRLAIVRERGYEIKPSSRSVGVTDIGYPIFGFDGRIHAALTIPFLTVIDGSQQVDIEHARKHMERAASKISNGLGWFGPER